ncbi:MAG: hypothetical protein IKB82_01870 [Clostridia bacterium]|nr:hypothetical protein [Clostridia bacterium]
MLKRMLATMLAAVMLLQPTMASAISWGDLVYELHNSGTGSYTSEDGTTAELDGDEMTITGGTVSDVDIGDDETIGKYTFVDVVIDGEVFHVWMNQEQAEIVLDGETQLNTNWVYMDVFGDEALASENGSIKLTVGENASVNVGEDVSLYIVSGSGELVNNGTIDAKWVSVRAFDGGEVSGENNGEMKVDQQFAIGAESKNEATGQYGETSSAEFVNNGSVYGDGWQDEEGNEYRNELHMFSRGDSQVSVTNNGTVDADMPLTGGNGDWDGDREETAPDDAKYTMEFTNNGEVNGIVNVSVWENGDTTTTNNGTVGEMATDVHEAGTSSKLINNGSAGSIFAAADSGAVSVEHNGTTEFLGGFTYGDAQSTINVNEGGVVTGDVGFDANGESSITISNSGTIENFMGGASFDNSSMTVENKGEVNGGLSVDSWGESELNMSNSGSVSGELYMGAMENSSGSLENSGEANHLFVSANGSGSATAENKGTVAGDTWFDAMGDSSLTVTNNGTFENGMAGGADENAALTLENKGDVSGQIYVEGWGEAEVGMTNSGTADAIWVNAFGASEMTAANDGTVNGEFGGGGYEDGALKLENNGESGSAWVDAYDNANVSYENNGAVAEGIAMSTDGSASLTVSSGANATDGGKTAYIFLGEGETITKEQIAEIMAKADIPKDTVIATVDEEGEITGEYEIAEDGTVQELGAAPEYEPYDEAKIYAAMRAADEALRQARAVGGVTTSIFWNKQMYLGHSTYNGRVYYKGAVEMTKQSLSWLPGGDAEGKNYTLRINEKDVNPADVEIRLAQDILDVCKRAGIAVITIVDKNNAPIAQYQVADLIAAREAYGLAADELICISADANAEVMKVTATGEYLPLEPKTEAAAEEQAGA